MDAIAGAADDPGAEAEIEQKLRQAWNQRNDPGVRRGRVTGTDGVDHIFGQVFGMAQK